MFGAPDGCWYYKLDLHVVGAYRRVGGATGNELWAGVFTYMDTGTYEKKWDEGASQPTTKPDGFWYGGTRKYARVGGCDNLGYLQNGYSFLDLINNPGGYGWDYGATRCFLVGDDK